MTTPTMHVDVVSAEEQIYSGEAEFVVLPGEAGELGGGYRAELRGAPGLYVGGSEGRQAAG